MSKRRPDVQLTKDNFEQEDEEVEVVNEPKLASEEVLKNRPMMKAKRRLDATDGNASSAIFSGLTGFGTNSTFDAFKFGNSTSNSVPSFGSATGFTILKLSENKPLSNSFIPIKSESDNNGHATIDLVSPNQTESKSDFENTLYTANLNKLNKTFYDHITKYMESTKLYDFTTVCTEYINQCKKLSETKNELSQEVQKKKNDAINSNQEASQGLFKFGGNKTSESNSPFKLPQAPFSFGSNVAFGGTGPSKSQFSFGSSTPSVFGNNLSTSTPLPSKFTMPLASQENNSEGGDGEEGEDTPPKVASVEHSENDAVFTKKCKLYYQKDGSYVDKGVGFLYIKTKDSAKPQLLIRSDTATGNILLNISLVDSLPVNKADKGKGVMLTCIPNPEIEPKKKDEQQNGERQTVTFLIRVKASDCDELYDTIIKHKSQN